MEVEPSVLVALVLALVTLPAITVAAHIVLRSECNRTVERGVPDSFP
jgi:hypothetical protein